MIMVGPTCYSPVQEKLFDWSGQNNIQVFKFIVMSSLHRHGPSKLLYVDLESFSLDIRVSQEQSILNFLLPFTGQSCYTVYL